MHENKQRPSSIGEIIETFADASDAPEDVSKKFADKLKDIADTIEELQQENSQLHSENEELNEEIKKLRGENNRLDTEVHRLEDELSEQREDSAKDRAKIKKRLTDAEKEIEEAVSEDGNVDTKGSKTTTHNPNCEPETALEDIVQLPSHVADESLSANQERSRFIAKDVHQYSRSAPAGKVIKSSELRKILAAAEEGTVHTQTVTRVLNMLDNLGEDDVEIKERGDGERVVVFTDKIVKRIVAWQNSNNRVVAAEEVTT